MSTDTTVVKRRPLLYLDSGTVEMAMTELEPLSLTRRVLELHDSRDCILPEEAVLRWEPEGGGHARSINMPGALLGDKPELGTKVINANTLNPASGHARADGLLILFDPQTAAPVCLMDAGLISALRTAAVSMVAINEFRSGSAQGVAAVIGAGELARRHVELLAERISWVSHVRVYDLDRERADRLVNTLSGRLTAEKVSAAESLEAACAGAGAVVCATTTETPYLEPKLVGPGTVVVNVGLDDVTDDLLMGCDWLVVDDWELIEADRKRALGKLLRSGAFSSRSADQAPQTATIGQCLRGTKPTRRDPTDVVVVNPFGMALCDVAFGHAIARIARQRGIGMELTR